MPSLPSPLADAAPADRAELLFGGIRCDAILRDRELEGAEPEESLFAAANRMWWRQVGALPVVAAGRLVGCLAEEDLLRVLAERAQAAAAEGGSLSVWDALLRDTRVGDAMTPARDLPRVGPDTSLLEGLRCCTAPDRPRGRYLFVVEETTRGQRIRLASYRDVAQYLISLYDGDFEPALFPSPAQAAAAQDAAHRVLGLPIGDPHHRRILGHPPNQVERGLSGVETLRSMWESQLGYVLVALPGGGPVGICTRRDVLRACVRRFADLERLPLTQLMSRRVKTVSDTDTLCGLFKRMALESCRHMPVVDAQDRARVVISMWEGVSLVAGA